MKYFIAFFTLFIFSGFYSYNKIEYSTERHTVLTKNRYIEDCSGTPCEAFSFNTTKGYLQVSPEKYFTQEVGSTIEYKTRKESSNIFVNYCMFVAALVILLLGVILLNIVSWD